MASTSILLKFVILTTLVAIIAATHAKAKIDPVGGSVICVVHSNQDLDKNGPWRDCDRVAFRGSSFTYVPFAAILWASRKSSSIEASDVGLIGITQNDFRSENNLQHLNVSRNKIRHLPSKVFTLLPKLISVDLSKNLISLIDDAAFSGASATLTSIDLSFNNIEQFKLEFKESYLMALNQSRNTSQQGVEGMSTNSSESQLALVKLKHLNLQHNQLKQFYTSALEIEELNLNDNQLEILFNLQQPTILSADNNNLTEFTITDRLQEASLKNNLIAKLKFDAKSKIEVLRLSGNKLSNESLTDLKDADKLRTLDLSNNMLRNWEVGTFTKISLLEELNLADNSIANLSTDLFADQGNLKVLNISHNNLSSIDLEIFTPLKSLETLDISGNDLNNFENLTIVPHRFPSLKMICLDDNDWTCEYYLSLVAKFNKQGISVMRESTQSTCPMTTESAPEEPMAPAPAPAVTDEPSSYVWIFTKAFIVTLFLLACGVGIAYAMIKFGMITFLRSMWPQASH